MFHSIRLKYSVAGMVCEEERDRNRLGNATVVSFPLPVGRDCSVSSMVEDALVSEVKGQWKRLWKERIDDPVRAEGVASMDFDKLFVERGTVVLATRCFKPVMLREILEKHRVADAERHMPLDKHVGGWRKFARTSLPKYASSRQRRGFGFVDVKKPQQLRKGGRGWLHV